MYQTRNLFSEVFGTLYALRWLTLAYVVVSCVLSVLTPWFVETWSFLFLYAPGGVVFWYFFYLKLFRTSAQQRSIKQFGSFGIWVFLLVYFITIGGTKLLSLFFEALPAETQEQIYGQIGYSLSSIFIAYVPYFLFVTLFPAKILRRSDGVREAISRTVRQRGYLIPRILGIYLPISVFANVLLAALLFSNAGLQPINFSGEVNYFGVLLSIVATILFVLSEAVFMVISKNAYVQDLRERGDLPEFYAEVFA